VLAVPVGPVSTLELLADDCDEVVAVERHEPFGAIGFFYDYFRQLEDPDVTRILKAFPARKT
jgi:predicted phosphoribosyltransferase